MTVIILGEEEHKWLQSLKLCEEEHKDPKVV